MSNPLITREDIAAFIQAELSRLFGCEPSDRGVDLLARFLTERGVKVG
jgi:hypothetical protein